MFYFLFLVFALKPVDLDIKKIAPQDKSTQLPLDQKKSSEKDLKKKIDEIEKKRQSEERGIMDSLEYKKFENPEDRLKDFKKSPPDIHPPTMKGPTEKSYQGMKRF